MKARIIAFALATMALFYTASRAAELFDINYNIGKGENRTPECLQQVEQFWQTREKIHRGIWGLGLKRNILARSIVGTVWYPSWADHVRRP